MFEAGDRVMIDRGAYLGEFATVLRSIADDPHEVRVIFVGRHELATFDEDDLQSYPATENTELDFDTVEYLELDGTGRDGNPLFPFTYGNVKQGIQWARKNGRNV